MTYFTAMSDKYATFVRPDQIEVGDFPVLDIDDEFWFHIILNYWINNTSLNLPTRQFDLKNE